jgi:hypothetical protein
MPATIHTLIAKNFTINKGGQEEEEEWEEGVYGSWYGSQRECAW